MSQIYYNQVCTGPPGLFDSSSTPVVARISAPFVRLSNISVVVFLVGRQTDIDTGPVTNIPQLMGPPEICFMTGKAFLVTILSIGTYI